MARRTATGVAPALVIIGVLVILVNVGLNRAIDWVEGVFGGETVEGVLVPPDQIDRIRQCTAEQLVAEKKCGDLPVVVIDAEQMPHVAHNISEAWKEGQPSLLTKASYRRAQNYRASGCGSFKRTVQSDDRDWRGSCDEYAFQSTEEGGANARIEEVPTIEQNRQGPAIGNVYTKHRLKDGDQFLVAIVNPDHIATESYGGS